MPLAVLCDGALPRPQPRLREAVTRARGTDGPRFRHPPQSGPGDASPQEGVASVPPPPRPGRRRRGGVRGEAR